MKTISFEEAQKMLEDVGHVANVSVPVKDEYGDENYKTVLNNGMVYNPYRGGQIGMSSNDKNAEAAMRFIDRRFRVHSSYFSWATGDYEVE